MRSGPVRLALAIALLAAATACAPAQTAPSPGPLTLTAPPSCAPTRADVPANYKADAPVRNKIGASGYVIEGIVMRLDCTPVPEARIEFWHVNAAGSYDDDHRATVVADVRGRYRLDTTRPVAYGGGPRDQDGDRARREGTQRALDPRAHFHDGAMTTARVLHKWPDGQRQTGGGRSRR